MFKDSTTDNPSSEKKSPESKNSTEANVLLEKKIIEDDLNKRINSSLLLESPLHFLSAMTKVLNELDNIITEKALRKKCHEYYFNNQELVKSWFQGITFKDYYLIEKVVEEFENPSQAIMGDPAIEGRILCHALDLEGIIIIGKGVEEENRPILNFTLIDKTSSQSKNIEEFVKDYLDKPKIVVFVKNGDILQFVPFLNHLQINKIPQLKTDLKPETPDIFKDPLTKKKMKNPVIDAFGVSYEKDSIEEWMKLHDISPTGCRYPHKEIVPNYTLKKLITETELNPDLFNNPLQIKIVQQQAQIDELKSLVQALSKSMVSMEQALVEKSKNQPSGVSFWTSQPGIKKILTLEEQQALQNQLVEACYKGDVLDCERLILQGSDLKKVALDGTSPLSAAIWGLNIKVVKKIIKGLLPIDDEYIQECLRFNEKKFNQAIPAFRPLEEIEMNDFASDYFKSQGRDVFFSEWIRRTVGLEAGSCIKLQVKNKATIQIITKAMEIWEHPINDRKLYTLTAPDKMRPDTKDHIICRAVTMQYIRCMEAQNDVIKYLKIYSPKTRNLEEIISVEVDSNIDDAFLVEKLLQHVVRGEQEQAHNLLKRFPELANMSGDIIDCSGRKFKGITAFQYALWALDWHMWTMLQGHLTLDEQKRQFAEQTEVTRKSGHGDNFDINPALYALRNYIQLFNKADDQLNWALVGIEQWKFPAQVVNEYCRPDRTFNPTPSFTESTLPRVVKKDKWNGDWWTAVYNGIHLGAEVSDKGWAVHRGWSKGGPGPWEGGEPTGCVTKETAKTDFEAMKKLKAVREEQYATLKRDLLEKSQYLNLSK